ncbi:hypothetical protein [Streptomyces ortus]|uniref:Uncharacterized protein n=1 Tax=Streptomyces ortus TaxID=2867268 RepID=A0ABT3UX08_9ACTN|nr:hypothetical protein [Streptomyces ortus]MCX4232071.1 hypothetical protein [Streptomyces ortus]
MNPAEELTAAADKLTPLAEAAQKELETGDYWGSYPKESAWRDGLTNGMGGASGDLAGALPPPAVRELARWLRAEARRLTSTAHPDWHDTIVNPHALAVARQILGSQP